MPYALSRRARATALALVLAVLAVLPTSGRALAAVDSTGTEFWLAFPTNYVGAPTLNLYLAGETPSTGTVAVPGTGTTRSFTTTPGQVTTVSLPSSTQVSTTDGIEARGIHVTASAPVSVYGLNRIQYTTDAYLGLPTQILGSEYVVMSHPGLETYGSEFAVVAPSDGTSVTVLPSVTTGTRRAGDPYTVELDRGEVYQLRASGTQDLTGTIITANRPVAAFSGASCANVPVGYVACDHLLEQLTPPNTWGSSFATVPLASRSGGDTFRFLAAQDGTVVTVDGEPVATIDAGEVHQQLLAAPSAVVSSKPILVAQFSNGQQFDGVVSDPFMMLVPPYEQFLSSYTVATPATGFARNYVNLVAPAGSSISLDGTAVPASSFQPIGSSGFVGAQVPIAAGAHRLEGSTTFGAFVYGFDSYDSYGYPAGLALQRFDPRSSLFGFRRAAGWVGDPVNTATGNLVSAVTDLDFPSVSGMDVVRTYNGLDDRPSALGRGWSISPSSSLQQAVDGSVRWHGPDGRTATFLPVVGGGFTRPEEVFAELTVDAGTFALRHFDGAVDAFDAEGRLVSTTRWDGQRVEHAYDDRSRIVSSTSSTGASVRYDYTGDRLTALAAGDGRVVRFSHDAAGRLATATDAGGGTTTYTSDAAGRLAREQDPTGRTVTVQSYDPLGRVVRQEQASGEVTTFVYDVAARSTTVTDDASGDVDTYVHDVAGRLLRVVDAAGAVLTKRYDDRGELVETTDRTGGTAKTTYDDHGNVTSTTDVAGGTTSTTYDALDRAVTTTDEVGAVTRLAYTADHRIPSSVTDPEGGVTTAVTDGGLVRSVTDADGVKTQYEWDASGRLVAAVDGTGARSQFRYDGVGRRTASVLPSGATTTVAHDGMGRVVATVDPLGGRSASTYDLAGRLLTSVDPTGATTAYAYDERGNVQEVVDPVGGVTSARHDRNGQLLSTTAPGGATTTYEYGPLGRLEAVTDPLGAVTRFEVDADGRRTTTVDAAGGRTTVERDARGLPVVRTTADGATTRSAYDSRGLLVLSTDALGATTELGYDRAGRLVSTTDATGAVERQEWTGAGRLAAVVDAVGLRTRIGYDAAGRRTTVTAPDGGVTTTAYDADGGTAATTTPTGVRTLLQHDAAGRVVRHSVSGSGSTSFTWTARGELATETDPLGATVRRAYDAAGRLTTTVDARGARTTYGYDARGNRTSLLDASGAERTWTFDLADRVLTSTDALGRTARYERDVLGRVTRSVDASGREQQLVHDEVGRVVERRWGEGQVDALSYDAAGRLTQSVDGTGTTARHYDAVGRLTQLVHPDGRSTRTGYDAAGRRTSTTYPDGRVADSTYDAGGRLATVAHPAVGTTTHTWDADGRLTAEVLPGGGRRAFAYDAAGRVIRFEQDMAGAARTTTLSRDLAGRIVGETTGTAATAYAYDPAGQLLSSTGPTLKATYAYDALGRRTAASINGASVAYAYDAAGQLRTETVDGAVRTYSHDDAGRRTGVRDAKSSSALGYDGRGLLTSVVETAADGTSSREQRSYDATGSLVEVTQTAGTGTTSTTDLTWDVTAAVPQVLSMTRGNAETSFLYGTRRLAAVGAGSTGAVGLFATDAHGSTVSTASTAAFAVGDGYDAWGNGVSTAVKDCNGRPVHPLDPNHCAGDAAGGAPPAVGGKGGTRVEPRSGTSSGTGAAPVQGLEFGYRGELQVDALLHLRARDYDPATGSFTTTDPLEGVDGTPTVGNAYHYADNDPLDLVDPLGLRPTDAQLRAGACTIEALDCAFDDFEGMTVLERRQWLAGFEQTWGQQYRFESWFNAIDGILHFAQDEDLITPGSWFSVVDAGILEGIQNGLASLQYGVSGLLNPGNALWEDFFSARQEGRVDDGSSRTLWGMAEQAATNYGLAQAVLRDISMPIGGSTFVSVGNVYRGFLSLSEDVEEIVGDVAHASCGIAGGFICRAVAEQRVDDFYDAIADPRNETLTYVGAHVLWTGGEAWELREFVWDHVWDRITPW